jgi:hypothetical protein
MPKFSIRGTAPSMLAGSLLIAALAAAPPGARAQQPTPAEMTRVHAEFGYFTGTWRCAEEWSKSDFSPAHKSVAILRAMDDLDGVWMVWSYQQQTSAANPHPAKGADFWGYDPQQKIFVRTKIDAYLPGKTTQLTSAGWAGNTVAWEGEAPTPKGPAPFVHSFTKIDDHTIAGKLFLGGQQFYSSTCTRQPG